MAAAYHRMIEAAAKPRVERPSAKRKSGDELTIAALLEGPPPKSSRSATPVPPSPQSVTDVLVAIAPPAIEPLPKSAVPTPARHQNYAASFRRRGRTAHWGLCPASGARFAARPPGRVAIDAPRIDALPYVRYR